MKTFLVLLAVVAAVTADVSHLPTNEYLPPFAGGGISGSPGFVHGVGQQIPFVNPGVRSGFVGPVVHQVAPQYHHVAAPAPVFHHAPQVNFVAPQVHHVPAPVFHHVPAPVVHRVVPQVHVPAPVFHHVAPQVHHVPAPIVDYIPPTVHHVAPQVHHFSAPAVRFASPIVPQVHHVAAPAFAPAIHQFGPQHVSTGIATGALLNDGYHYNKLHRHRA